MISSRDSLDCEHDTMVSFYVLFLFIVQHGKQDRAKANKDVSVSPQFLSIWHVLGYVLDVRGPFKIGRLIMSANFLST